MLLRESKVELGAEYHVHEWSSVVVVQAKSVVTMSKRLGIATSPSQNRQTCLSPHHEASGSQVGSERSESVQSDHRRMILDVGVLWLVTRASDLWQSTSILQDG
jgi:hypothetical protein